MKFIGLVLLQTSSKPHLSIVSQAALVSRVFAERVVARVVNDAQLPHGLAPAAEDQSAKL
jgi:hypothetical protein